MVGPVVAATGDQAQAVAIALQAEAVAVVFHLMEPVGAGGDGSRFRGEAEIKLVKHVVEIGISGRVDNPRHGPSGAELLGPCAKEEDHARRDRGQWPREYPSS